MIAKIRHNKEIITLEKEGCAKDEIFTSALKKSIYSTKTTLTKFR